MDTITKTSFKTTQKFWRSMSTSHVGHLPTHPPTRLPHTKAHSHPYLTLTWIELDKKKIKKKA